MSDVAGLLFELGSEDRVRILAEINKGPIKASQLARNLSQTIQETSRQCGRLEEKQLISKGPDGRYGLTNLGGIVLRLLPSFVLIQREREYFKGHDTSRLPSGFIERIGELLEHERLDHIDATMNFQEKIVRESERFVWFMSDQPVGHSLREDHSHFSKEIVLRVILPKQVNVKVFRSARASMGARFQIGLVDEVRLVIAMNEKSAGVGFPTSDGRIDYGRGLAGENPRFWGWCRDLFSYYWERSAKKYPEE